MSQNLVIPNKDNKVVFVFSGVDLTLATNIVTTFGAESYQLADAEVSVDSATELSIDLSGTAEVGKIFATVTYFDSASVNGADITSRELGNSGQIVVAIGTQLIIEDGSQVNNANSFVTDAEYKAYADLRGLNVASTQPEREAHLVAAIDYLQSLEGNIQGVRTSSSQPLLFPRSGVVLYGFIAASDNIPQELKNAQMEAAVYATSGSLLINSSNNNIKSEQLDSLRVEYFPGGKTTSVNLQRVNAQLSHLMKSTDTLVRT